MSNNAGDARRSRFMRTSKEVGRHVLHHLGVQRKFGYLAPEQSMERFTRIYEERVWARGNPDNPGSGAGSTIEATSKIRAELPRLLDRLGAHSVLDLGCGDFTWMQEVDLTQEYFGVDIVPSVIENNVRLFSGPKRHFEVGDGTVDALPEADTVLCREVLFHLSFADIRSTLENVFSTPRRHLITTTDTVTMFNSDIRSGDFRFLNLRRRPFRLGPPVDSIEDSGLARGRNLGVWVTESVVRSMGLRVP